MGKRINKKKVFVNQLKTLENLEQKINQLVASHSRRNGSHLGIAFRTVIDPNEPTLYKEGHHGRGNLIEGIRECDYKISKADPNWVLASPDHGLSFSSTMKHAINTMKFLGGFQKKGTKISCAYWILENNSSIPEDMEFVQDPDNPEHYLLTITRDMTISELVNKLKWIAQRMTVMNDLALEA
ncbi:hypothetical protein OQJ46_12130 [Microbulbifer thermotolerans]|uniref:Uncharacterized protein n=1 Tax=Microbulbifer thermotolerans TaxID=252514 RepID=A0AB35I1R8_MICTH|nr:hypothetical protein [Microbulbifer thermotolerans]MCX2783734.1 hypothetical protein [Microbulbifer thermotolerans]MCX2803096.1 hypothetical protein [Microbulbifer thermotolerans]WKT60428.1 hypothetical protein Q2E61_16180 [Microbulbifer thermotolerans]